ncbi:hypothetical protein [Klebsiella oxytoca]|uniref:hypothetical protein n=1 Tax=Klebsiella oxytoca TaxID=571 RepID=UPI002A3590EE|nr:hypothetical protein [Klebsiella oxytoca]
MPGVIFFCISNTLVPTTYLVDTTLSDASDYDQTVHAVRLQNTQETAKPFSEMSEHEKAAVVHEKANNGQSSVIHQQQAEKHRSQITQN